MRSSHRFRLGLTVLLLAASVSAAVGLGQLGHGLWALLALLPALWSIIDLYRGHAAVLRELAEFTEAVRYRDFSRQYGRRGSRPELRQLHQHLLELNAAFRAISREKETQQQHLHTMLALIQTGILSYEPASGTVWWLNDALQELLRLPQLKNISGLARRYPALAARLTELRPGPPQLVTVPVGAGTVRLLLAASVFQTDGRQYKLVAFQDVSETLDETEADAWQKLLRVLTHEIMNSVAPIASLAETLQQRLATADPHDPDLREDLELGISTIKRRSDGLLQFSATYRSLSKVSVPNREVLPAYALLEAVHHLLQPKLQARGIVLEIVLPDPQLRLQADRVLLEQVLINLVLNAIDALSGRPAPRITLTATTEADRPVLRVADNGAGMDAETQEQVFVPFFTTKKNGSGIGLSLCKQIMLLHKGNIQLRSTAGAGTVVTLTLGAG